MKDAYLGSQEDQHFIASYLTLMRSITPYEMFLTRKVKTLADLLQNPCGSIDPAFFQYLAGLAASGLQEEYSIEFELAPPDRYYIGEVIGPDWGGFHSDKAVGYHNVFRAGFGVLLS